MQQSQGDLMARSVASDDTLLGIHIWGCRGHLCCWVCTEAVWRFIFASQGHVLECFTVAYLVDSIVLTLEYVKLSCMWSSF